MRIQYSIRDIEKLTGIKAHTLRIWEQRYGFVIPHRTDTNIRFYDDEQLKYLINVAVLIKNGRKISKVAYMSPENVYRELLRLSSDTPDKDLFFELQTDALVMAMIDLDEDRFEKVISLCSIKYGFERTMVKVITPFLGKVGILWSVSEVNVAQEHFISNLIRQKLIVAIDAHAGKGNTGQKYLLFLPEGEYHELGLLFAKYLIRAKGHSVIYLGQSLPFDDLVKLGERYRPHFVLTYFTAGLHKMSIADYLARMGAQVQCEQFLICGPKALAMAPKPTENRFVFLKTVEDLLQHLNGKHPV